MSNKLAEMLLRSNRPEALVLSKLFETIPEEYRNATSNMYEQFVSSKIRGLGELSAAELAIKLADWMIENQKVA